MSDHEKGVVVGLVSGVLFAAFMSFVGLTLDAKSRDRRVCDVAFHIASTATDTIYVITETPFCAKRLEAPDE